MALSVSSRMAGRCAVGPSLILFFFLSVQIADTTKDVTVTVSQGALRGLEVKTRTGIKYYSFRGIPYARPPEGSLRFKPPVPLEEWEGVFDSTREGPECPQLHMGGGPYKGKEDCLVLNVYTTQIHSSKTKGTLPVMVFLHGGAFAFGSGSSYTYGPGRLIEENVVLVTLNYRLGPLGFLNTEDQVAPGNYGLLDQQEALRWVQKNIAVFGGDSLHVTLFGQSAGAASVLYHMLAQSSKGLFHRVIMQSGSPLCRWAFQQEPLLWSQTLGLDLGCHVDSSSHLVDCLRTKTAEEIITKTRKYYKFLTWPVPFVPSVGGKGQSFLNATPIELLEAGQFHRVPVIIGINKDEGALLYCGLKSAFKEITYSLYEKINTYIFRGLLKIYENLPKIAIEIKNLYFKNLPSDAEEAVVRQPLIELLSDGMHTACNDQTVRLLMKNGVPTYMYVLEHTPATSITQTIDVCPEPLGVAHGDDLQFIFDRNMLEQSLSEDDEKMSAILLKMWTNFAKLSVPVLDTPRSWIPGSGDKIRYMKLTLNPKEQNGYRTKKVKFWNYRLLELENAVKHDEL